MLDSEFRPRMSEIKFRRSVMDPKVGDHFGNMLLFAEGETTPETATFKNCLSRDTDKCAICPLKNECPDPIKSAP